MFTQIEGNKSSDTGSFTKCNICGKEFYEQYHFYEHAIRKHSQFVLKVTLDIPVAMIPIG